jgi:uncharacterized membrane protein YsdA (DUF1294 family)
MVDFILSNLKEVLIYLLAINLIGFLAMGIDKFKAKQNLWRTKEKTLFAIAMIGGSIGSIIGMYTFRHKTKHNSFVVGFPIILIAQIVLVSYLIINY